jgi:exonuclease III
MEKGINFNNLWIPKKEMAANDIQSLVERSRVTDNIFPPWDCRDKLRWAYGRFSIGNAFPIEGQGLFLRPDASGIAQGEMIGIYAGVLRSGRTAYSLDIGGDNVIDGTPVSDDPIWFMGRINDWIWDEQGQNCRILKGGVIVATKWIKPGDQLFMSYSADYDWGSQKWNLFQNTWDNLRQLLRLWEISDYMEDLAVMESHTSGALSYDECKDQLGELAHLVKVFLQGMPESDQHRFEPRPLPAEKFANWVERVLRCREWVQRFSFRSFRPHCAVSWSWVQAVRSEPMRHPRAVHKLPVVEHSDDGHMYVLKGVAGSATTGLYTRLVESPGESIYKGKRQKRQSGISVSPAVDAAPPTIAADRAVRVDILADGERQRSQETPVVAEPSVSTIDTLSATIGFRFMMYNVGGLQALKCNEIVNLIRKNKSDYVALIDVRMTAFQISVLSGQLKKRLGSVYHISGLGLQREGAGTVGGQIQIYRRDVCRNVSTTQEDQVGGMVTSDMVVGHTKLRVISVYWPVPNNSATSLYQILGGKQCIPQMQSIAQAKIEQACSDGRTVLYSGDFNSDLNGTDRYNLAEHVAACHLVHSSANLTDASYISKQGTSRIDYCMHRGGGILNFVAKPIRLRHGKLDHLPICGVFRLLGQVARKASMRQILEPDVDMKNLKLVEKIRAEFAKICVTNGSPEEQLAQIVNKSVAAVRKHQYRRKGWRDGWSPTMVALQCALGNMIHCRRCIKSSGGVYRWTEINFKAKRRAVFHSWSRSLRKIAGKKPETMAIQLRQWLDDPQFHWSALRRVDWQFFGVVLETQIAQARRQLQGRQRTRMRMQMDNAVVLREQRRAAGKLRPVLASMLGPNRKQRQKYDMECIKADGAVITDPQEIHGLETATFRRWLETPSEIRVGTIGHVLTHHSAMSTSEAVFVAAHCADGVPVEVLQLIHAAAQIKVEPNMQLCAAPSWEDFDGSINSCKTNSAPGMSGLSYNMIKLWPEALRKQVYTILALLWEERITPEAWKRRWLVPIPKVDDPGLADLRPLVLIEALRKVWMRCIAKRIQEFWTEEQVLHGSQHGCVPDRGTDSASIILTHDMETTKEFMGDMFMTSFDATHAFDCVSKPLCVHSLVRLGVPLDVAEYIIGMDRGGEVVVRSPLALSYVKRGLPTKSLSFQAERGTGQGDVTSPMIWTALFDVLLCALAAVQGGGLMTRDRNGVCRVAEEVAYADDLVSIQGTAEALQRKADVTSGFCITCGLQLATQKFRAFAINWGNEWHEQARFITIHSHGWVPVQVPLSSDGFLKYLGRNLDMHLSGGDAEVSITKYCANALAYVSKRRSSVETKMLAIKLCIIPKVIYALKFMAWPLVTFTKLERKFSQCFRTITKNLLTFPTALLYISVEHGGLGCPSLVDAVHRAKFSLAMRGLGAEVTRHSMSGLLARGITYMGNPVRPNIRVCASGTNWTDSCWARSLLEWTRKAKVNLVAEGAWMAGGEMGIMEWTEANGQVVPDHDFRSMMCHGEATLHDLQLDDVETAVFLRVGQCWATAAQCEAGHLMEILVLDKEWVDYILWHTSGVVLSVGVVIELDVEEFSIGAGTRTSHAVPHVDFVQHLNDASAVQVFTSGDSHSKIGRVHNVATVLRLMRRSAHFPCQFVREESTFWGAEAIVGVCRGHAEPRSLERSAADLENSAGALVVQEGNTLTTLVVGGEYRSKDQVEQMTTILACFGASHHIVYPSSTKSERELWRVASGRGLKALSSWNLMGLVGHNKTIVTKKERAVGGDTKNVVDVEVARVQKSKTIEAVMAYKEVPVQDQIRSHLEYYWEDEQGRLIYNIEDEVASMRTMEYCFQRDQYRALKARLPRWARVPSQLAADMWRTRHLSLGERARTVRILWDKHWNGENQLKAGCLTPDICSHCGTTSGQRHTVQDCSHPGVVRLRADAKKAMVTARRQLPVEGKEAKILGILEEMMEGDESYSIWTGMWTVGVRESFAGKNGHEYKLDDAEYKTVVKVLGILAEAVDKMLYVQQAAVVAEVMEVTKCQRRKPSIGGQWTLEEFGVGSKRSHEDIEDFGSQLQEAQATAPDARMVRRLVRSIREDDSSQFDVG